MVESLELLGSCAPNQGLVHLQRISDLQGGNSCFCVILQSIQIKPVAYKSLSGFNFPVFVFDGNYA